MATVATSAETLPETSDDTGTASAIEVWDAADVLESLERLRTTGRRVTTTILDPWYNKGVGGTRPDYYEFLDAVLQLAARVSTHVFLWGFPEIMAPVVAKIPTPLSLVAWLTWYYKNSPSVIRGWRSSQMTCLHMATPGAKLYPEHFLNDAQLEKLAEGKLRYMPGPTSVIDYPLLCGFVGKREQLGHPSQKPVAVIEPLLLMTTKARDVVFDPMCGSGTTGEAARRLNRVAILCDSVPEYVTMSRNRLLSNDLTADDLTNESGLFGPV